MELAINSHVYSNGDQLILIRAIGTWVGIAAKEVIELFYGEKTEEGFDVHQTEYFSTYDLHTAKEAFFKRLGDGQAESAVKACGLGYDLETVDKYEAVIQKWHKNFGEYAFGKISKTPIRVFTNEEVNAQQLSPFFKVIKQTIIFGNGPGHSVIATFCSNEHCFVLRALNTDKEVPKTTSCSFSLPLHIAPRPGFEDGVLKTIEEHEKLFHKEAVQLQTIFQVAKFLYENDHVCVRETVNIS